jgi:hypothetical protein
VASAAATATALAPAAPVVVSGRIWACRARAQLGFIVHARAIPNPADHHCCLASSVQAQPQAQRPVLEWKTFVVPEYGTKIDYPAGIFVPAGDPEKGVGQKFDRSDGRAVLTVYSRDNEQGDTPASYLKKNLRVDRSAIGYQRVTRGFFAISMDREDLIFYSRCNFSRRGAIHCFDLAYPKEEERAWDAIVTRISLSLRPLEG